MQGRGSTFTRVISLFAALVATSVVLGMLGAGLMMPTVAATGAAAREGVAIFDALPGEFTQNPLSEQSRILASDGTLIATPYDENRVIVPLAKIAPIMRQAQVAIEDSRFYEHGGVDIQGVGRAVVSNFRGGNTQGASTLTQQYVKITLQENALRNDDAKGAKAATAKNYTRKLQELKYAVTLEKTLTKNQILQGYLNLVYYGGQAYGVEAAARQFFGVSAAKLSLPQAATLAGLVQLPSQTDPLRSPAKALARRNVVLDRMHTLKLISDRAWREAKKTKLVTKSRPARNSCALSPYPYFCDYVGKWLLDLPALGKTRDERAKQINRGGLTIQTTLDPKDQAITEQELVAKVPIGTVAKNWDIGAAAAVIEPGTGHVLAIAQNTKYSINAKAGTHGQTSVNWAVDQKYGGSAGFAFGSTAKMFAVAEALRSGMSPSSSVVVPTADPTHGATFYRSQFHDECGGEKGRPPWTVHNDEGSSAGRITLTVAAAKSVNTAFAALVIKLGACKVRDMMTTLGLHTGSGKPISNDPSNITLGSASVSPLTLASAYATVASGGTYCEPSPVLSITTSDKKSIALPKSQCRKVLDPDVASGVTQILKTVLTNGTASRVGGLDGGRPVAGKTGTAGNATPAGGTNETWFVGYTPQLSTAVWVGTPTDDRQTARLNGVQIGSTYYPREIYGADIAAPIWKKIMDRISVGMPFLDFGAVSNEGQSGEIVPVPDVAGLSVGDAEAVLRGVGFSPVVGGAESSNIPVGRVVGTDPGIKAPLGATIVIKTSAGSVNPPRAIAPRPVPVVRPPAQPVVAAPKAPVTKVRGKLPRCRPNGPRPCSVRRK